MADQKLNPANSALLGNIQVGGLGGRVAGWEGGRQRLLHSICRGMPRHALAICVDALHARCWPNHGACASPCVQLGIPVRVTRKQTDKHGHYGCAYVYDGLVSQALGGCSSAADQPASQPASLARLAT